jgi:hypothetical protein
MSGGSSTEILSQIDNVSYSQNALAFKVCQTIPQQPKELDGEAGGIEKNLDGGKDFPEQSWSVIGIFGKGVCRSISNNRERRSKPSEIMCFLPSSTPCLAIERRGLRKA